MVIYQIISVNIVVFLNMINFPKEEINLSRIYLNSL